ncbi:MAG: protocatechuate 3,4-dioxygenase subunit alpha [Acidimicrobiales bacterium]
MQPGAVTPGTAPPGATPSQTAGPFFSFGLAPMQAEVLVEEGEAGAVHIRGTVTDGAGEPVPDAMVEIWQADPAGRFPPETAPAWSGFGRSLTDPGGGFRFLTCKPGRVPGADGTLQAPHISVQVFSRGLLRQLVTRIYFPDEVEANEVDPVLAGIEDPSVRATLVARAESGSLRFDIRLQGAGETAFFAI